MFSASNFFKYFEFSFPLFKGWEGGVNFGSGFGMEVGVVGSSCINGLGLGGGSVVVLKSLMVENGFIDA